MIEHHKTKNGRTEYENALDEPVDGIRRSNRAQLWRQLTRVSIYEDDKAGSETFEDCTYHV